MHKLEYFKEDGTSVMSEHHTRKAACHQAKRVGVPFAYITGPDGIREKVRFDGLKDDINPASASLELRTRRQGSREWKRK